MEAVLSQSFLDFLTNSGTKGCKISKWLSSGNKYVNRKLLSVGNYFSFREQSGLVSYCPAGREQGFTESGAWKREGRDVIKPGKLLKKIFPFILTDQDIEQFVGRFKAAEKLGDFNFATTADDIDRIYDQVCSDSCMRGREVGEFYHCVKAQVLYLRNGDEIVGRAVVWKITEPDITYMDRIYGAEGEQDWVEQKFMDYAKTMGWYHKRSQDRFQNTPYVSPEGEVRWFAMKIKTPNCIEADFYPYLDTFKSGGDKSLYNEYGMGEYDYEHTEGHRTDEDEEAAEHEGEVQLENGDWCDEDDAVIVDGDYYHRDDCVICHRTGDYILESDAYAIQISRNETIYIHEDYVNRC